MIKSPVRNPLDDVADFLTTAPNDEQLLAFYLADDLQKRLNYLLDLNGAGELTDEEERELDDFIRADHMVSRLKTKTKLRQQGLNDSGKG